MSRAVVTTRALRALFTLAIAVVVAWVVWQAATTWGKRSGLFPLVIGVPVLVLSVVQLAIDGRILLHSGQEEAPAHPEGGVPRDLATKRTVGIVATLVGFVAGVWLFGFVVAVPLITFLYLKVAARESWAISITLSTAAGVSFYGLFVLALGVPAPFGVLLSPLLE